MMEQNFVRNRIYSPDFTVGGVFRLCRGDKSGSIDFFAIKKILQNDCIAATDCVIICQGKLN